MHIPKHSHTLYKRNKVSSFQLIAKMMKNICFILVILIFSGAKQIYGNKMSVVNIISVFYNILFWSGDTEVKDIKGRLLTPEEGCGLTKVKATRILGGGDAPVGKSMEHFCYTKMFAWNRVITLFKFVILGAWPWIVVLGYARKDNVTAFDCGKKIRNFYMLNILNKIPLSFCFQTDL